MDNTAAALKARATTTQSVLTDAVRARAVAKPVVNEKFKDIAANTFYKIAFSKELSPEQKQAAMQKAMVFTNDKKADRERKAEHALYMEWLAHIREEMAKEIISLTSTETFSELQKTYGDFTNDLNTFEEAMAPLTAILEALYTLRTNGETFNALSDIRKDKEREATLRAQLAEKDGQVRSIGGEISDIDSRIATLGEDKLLGFLGVKKRAREEIARLEAERAAKVAALEGVRTEVTKIGTDLATVADTGPFAQQKAELRKLLDITSDEHRNRQKALVEAAKKFVESAKSRTGSIHTHLGTLGSQIVDLFDNSTRMTTMHAMMADAITKANDENLTIRSQYQPPGDGKKEDMLTKTTREQALMDLDDHIADLNRSAVKTTKAHAALSEQLIRVRTMRDGNTEQMEKTHDMHTQGVAGVAERLSTVLQAVSAAALGESSAMAKDTLNRMTDSTNIIAQKEVIRVATGLDDTNADLVKAINDLGAYGEVISAAKDISTRSLTDIRANMKQLEEMAEATTAAVKEAIGAAADVAAGEITGKEKTAKETADDGFKFAGN